MSESSLCLKPISSLLTDQNGDPVNYFIPAYQRGYRWSPLQVRQLLDDIWEWESSIRHQDPDPEQFYCLQPLVVRVKEKSFEVVDGQQRLTTILLILHHLNKRMTEDYRRSLFKITFETRRGFDDFLNEPSEELASTNVDFYHLHEAMQAIGKWFKAKLNHVNDIESALLNRTQVIWFQLGQNDKPIEAFTRLNVGKIPLTDDELIRALFLRAESSGTVEGRAHDQRQQIAHEWDTLEKALQDPPFWGFLSNESERRHNRIGFLFEKLAQSYGLPPEVRDDPFKYFFVFSKRMKDGHTPRQEWLRVKEEFMRLQEWYEDRVLYHIVGFLLSEEVDLNEVRQLSLDCTKTTFNQRLRERVFSLNIGSLPEAGLVVEAEDTIRELVSTRLQDLEYGTTAMNKKIHSILLLFNVATLLQDKSSNIRFQFDCYKEESWNIEHVRSVTSNPMNSHLVRKNWMEGCLRYLKDQNDKDEKCLNLISEMESYLALPPRDALQLDFEPLLTRVLERFGESKTDEVENGIANLALLDERTNKSYQNAPFAVKRTRILSLDQAGIFVPLCTRNVFLKCYSQQVGEAIFWGERDQQGYFDAMVKTLTGFFLGRVEDHS
ncbi:uncharacterized protein DUF1524 [Roseimicrobium gellanilyticum]|uniref:Uncharacterized protein DUF1524 n=1 Tax=Roseimicrobium gellanilyticum TaxID=748857 RepID=A0A366HNQ3_9BACT|nr:DUF262 domain-containing protein [Roseimicrobium gellanilyticum]RBP43605.1 uncharacterized protein DUF1524 [Roseimicrobium gellanilyticum]